MTGLPIFESVYTFNTAYQPNSSSFSFHKNKTYHVILFLVIAIKDLFGLGSRLIFFFDVGPLSLIAISIAMVEPPNDPDAGCKLLDGFAIIIQILLASSALATLVVKRARERPQRPVNIWYGYIVFARGSKRKN